MLIKIVSLLSFIIFSSQASVPHIRVKVGKSLGHVFLTGLDLEKKLHYKKSKKSYLGKSVLNFDCQNLKKYLVDTPMSKKIATVNSPSGLIKWNGSKYLGSIDILVGKNGSGCDVIHKTNLENYLSSLLTKEMNKNWPIEALKAQAVAARSYAFFMMKSKRVAKKLNGKDVYDLESSENYQVSGNFDDQTKKSNKATLETKGEILITGNGELSPIFFHAKCGGHTLVPEEVWSHSVSGYEKRDCPFCHEHGVKSWKKDVNSNEIKRILGIKNNEEIKIISDINNRTHLRYYNGAQMKVLKKSVFRKKLGTRFLKSNNWKMTFKNNKFTFSGQGHGHGVGMCQTGAFAMAKLGYDYKKILKYYYPNFQIDKIY